MPIRKDLKPLYQTPEALDANAAARARAAGRCECVGGCGLSHVGLDASGAPTSRCCELDGQRALFQKGKVILTVAHRDHDPRNNNAGNLRAYCQGCHLRHDRGRHRQARRSNRDRKHGQTSFPNFLEEIP